MAKLKMGVYWACSCGGCDIAMLEIGERILKVAELADIVFWPCIADFKIKDVESYEDKSIDVVFWNGGIRNTENEHIAKLIRRKTKLLVAYGSCANEGCIPSLLNLYSNDEMMKWVYDEAPSVDNSDGVRPKTKVEVPEGELTLPALRETLVPLDRIVEVDYRVPGCPPAVDTTWAAIEAIASGDLPEKGAHLGCGNRSVCDECPLEKRNVKISKFYRVHEKKPEPGWCLLEQGFLCMGPATRSGCGAQCLNAGMPCRGCYGPQDGVEDQGAKILSAIGSLIDSDDEKTIRSIVDQIKDPAGTFYRFGMGKSILMRRKI